jgi:hypothetical protein
MMFTGTTFTGQLDSVPVAELMGRKPAPHTRVGGQPAQLGAGRGARPRVAARCSVDHAEQRPYRHLHAVLEPGIDVFESPLVHADLEAPVALSVTN